MAGLIDIQGCIVWNGCSPKGIHICNMYIYRWELKDLILFLDPIALSVLGRVYMYSVQSSEI